MASIPAARASRRALLAFVLGTAAGLPTATRAQSTWAGKTVKIVVGFPAGGAADIIARAFAQRVGERLKANFIVDNRPGAGSNLATQAVAKAPPDGRTLLLGSVPITVAATLHRNSGFSTVNDVMPLAMVASAATVLVVSPKLGVGTVSELVAMAKAQPGKLFFASAGIGTAPHLTGELFNMVTGVKMVHVPYKGNQQALIDMSEGLVSAIFTPAPQMTAFVKDGRARPLAVAQPTRSALLPDLPTMEEAGVAGLDTPIWYGFFAPKGTPAALAKTLSDELLLAARSTEMKVQLALSGAEPLPMDSVPFADFLRRDVQRWAKVIDFAKITATE